MTNQPKEVKKVIKLINGELLLGSVQGVQTENGVEILIQQPYIASNGNIMPYCVNDLGNGPGAVQIHPMNILWTNPLSDFPQVSDAYFKATTKLDLTPQRAIIT